MFNNETFETNILEPHLVTTRLSVEYKYGTPFGKQ